MDTHNYYLWIRTYVQFFLWNLVHMKKFSKTSEKMSSISDLKLKSGILQAKNL